MVEEKSNLKKRKKIELIVLISIILWLFLFGINYLLYSKGKTPIFTIPRTIKYEDGTVKEWIGLGYVYRIYNRNSITKEEFVPFWVLQTKVKPSLEIPLTYQDYSVPKNEYKERRLKGILYFYTEKRKLIGTYKCINTSVSCDWAGIGVDSDNLINKDPFTKIDTDYRFAIMYEKYAFIEDSLEQNTTYGDPLYSKTIYLFSILENKIIARYEDIKPSVYGYSYVEGTDYNYIVKDYKTHKWGVIHLEEDGTIKELLPFLYTSISYDKDTGFYITHQDDFFGIYDIASKKEIVGEVSSPIYDVWINDNQSLFYKIGEEIEGEIIYCIYRENKEIFFENPNAIFIASHPKFIYYVDKEDKQIKFMDYSLTVRDSVQLYFTEMSYDKHTHPAFLIDKITNGIYYIKVYKGPEEKSSYDYRSVNTKKLFGNTNTM